MDNNQSTTTNEKPLMFWEKAMTNLTEAKNYASLIKSSDAISRKYYTKTEDVLYAIQYGVELGLPASQALQVLIPAGGKMTMIGDGAKALVFSSNLIEKWEEKELEDGYQITSTRKGITITRSFTFDDAKKAGLFITEEDVKHSPVLKKSPWYTHQIRMCYYRALGYLLRDLYSDVIKGISLYEEVMDFHQNRGVVVESASGKEIKLSDPKKALEQSESLAGQALDTSVRREEVIEEVIEEKEELEKEVLVRQLRPMDPLGMPESALAKMGNPMAGDFYTVIKDTIVEFLMEELPGKKTNAKARKFIVAIEDDSIETYLESKYGEESLDILAKGREMIVRSGEPAQVVETQNSLELANEEAQDKAEKEAKEELEVKGFEAEVAELPKADSFKRDAEEDLVKAFDKEDEDWTEVENELKQDAKLENESKEAEDKAWGELEEKQNKRTDIVAQNGNEGEHYEESSLDKLEAIANSNPYDIEIPELEDGERDAITVIDLMEAFSNINPELDHERYARITKGLDIAKTHPDLDDLLEKGTVKQINDILIENAE